MTQNTGKRTRQRAPQEPRPQEDGLDARNAALSALVAVLRKHQPLDAHLDIDPEVRALSPRDRAFARALVATTLRRLGQIDALLDGYLTKPLPSRARTTRDILRLGCCQILFLDVPPHAAVDTAVRLAKQHRQKDYANLVNGVLRRAEREGEAVVAEQDAARLNTPEWLWTSWRGTYGEDTCRAIARAHLNPAPLDITVKAEPARWAERLGGIALATGSVRVTDAGPVTDMPGFGDGAWWIQDAAATLPATLLGDVKGKKVLDLCAAPGGKTLQLAHRGAHVTAVDRSEKRLERLRDNLSRLELSAEVLASDGLQWNPEHAFDAVLLDAPCSATGTIRRHPDLSHLKGPADVETLTGVQERLLRRAAGWLKPGGVLVYCTCSLENAEGPAQISRLLAAAPGLALSPLTADDVPGLPEAIDKNGMLRTLPSQLHEIGGLDGFFAARLIRT